ncbi:hypothetical protein [Pseudonocardia sp. ICBG1142]|uniref:hypothetical protein n=1 Tax=Pseudonocardia sp. ICBG1142 TaxID=2846760 RepID=UPI001CF6CD05|nr:hypothetical protein [Pseudonocardia sp. ICBG1142]
MLGAAAGGAVRPVGVNAVLVICRQDFDLPPGKDLRRAAEVLTEHFTGLLRRGVLSRAVAAVILNPARHGHDRDLLSVEIDVVARDGVAGLATALNTIRDGFRLLPVALSDRFTAAEVEHLAGRVVGADGLQTSTRKID